ISAVGLALAAPLPHAFLAAAYVFIAFGSSLPEPAIVSSTFTGISKFLLLAIPSARRRLSMVKTFSTSDCVSAEVAS
ncbi:hypothetical protein ACC754_44860, partial [Rhizobium johnstonii]